MVEESQESEKGEMTTGSGRLARWLRAPWNRLNGYRRHWQYRNGFVTNPEARHLLQFLPQHLVGAIGEGNFWETGRENTEFLIQRCGLMPHHRVLDVGCGLGRIAFQLQGYLSRRGWYEGFDIVREMIEWDRAFIGQHVPHFRFQHVDIHNSAYNLQGTIDPETFRFPYDDACFDFAFATSLFTHLLERSALRYWEEMARCLRPRGRCVFTCFLIDDIAKRQSAARRSEPKLAPHEGPTWIADPADPEAAVGFEEPWLLAQLARLDLQLDAIHRGWWRGHRAETPPYQDFVIATRR